MGEWNTKIWFINGVDNVNWPPYRDLLWRRANARNVSFSIHVQWSIYIINSVNKPNNRDLLVRVFSVLGGGYQYLLRLVHCIVCVCYDWPECLLWFWVLRHSGKSCPKLLEFANSKITLDLFWIRNSTVCTHANGDLYLEVALVSM